MFCNFRFQRLLRLAEILLLPVAKARPPGIQQLFPHQVGKVKGVHVPRQPSALDCRHGLEGAIEEVRRAIELDGQPYIVDVQISGAELVLLLDLDICVSELRGGEQVIHQLMRV